MDRLGTAGARLALFLKTLLREETTMRGKSSHDGHDPRQIDLLAVVALVLISLGGFVYLASHWAEPVTKTSFVVPSQHVRW
jgi:hypothetical protein